MPDSLLILGASTRAAASSALRAGLTPSAVDLFCDDDLRQSAPVTRRADAYPDDLPRLARSCPPSAWMFTGALENHPQIIDAISAERVLWGVPSPLIRRLRDPVELARALRSGGLHSPEVICGSRDEPLPRGTQAEWLKKPLRSAGGARITRWVAGREFEVATAGAPTSVEPTASQAPQPDAASPSGTARLPYDDASAYFLQRLIEGQPQSAVFVAAHGAARLLGVTRQLIGTAWAGATGFCYAGSIGPLQLPVDQSAAWSRIGACLASEFDLRGLFGVDAVVNESGIWTIEVNPRYTSSIEVLECGCGIHAIAEHVAALRDGQLNQLAVSQPHRFRGKAILYASRDVPIEAAFVREARLANRGLVWPVIADIPTAGQTIAAGHPVATVFVTSETLAEVEPRLQANARDWRARWRL